MKKKLLLIIGFFLISFMSFGRLANNYGFKAVKESYTSLREILCNNAPLFKETESKTAVIEKHRIWMNLTNTEGAFKQILVGYATGATNGVDTAYDGLSIDSNKYIDFYSIIGNQNYVIQGRALPFSNTDQVPLGYKTAIEGTFEISIAKVDGLFATQTVFVEDKVTHIIHNLTDGSFSFTTGIGVFNDRFVLRYTDNGPVMPPIVVEPPVVVIPPVVVEQPVVNPPVIMPPVVVEQAVVVTPPIVLEAPVVVEAPVVGDSPVVVEIPAVVTPPIVVDSPVIVEPSVVATPVVVVETPIVVDSPVVVDSPIVLEAPVVVTPVVVVESPIVVDSPVIVEPSVVESPVVVDSHVVIEAPVIVEPSVVATAAVAVETPIVVDSPIVIETPVVVTPVVVVESPVVVDSPIVIETLVVVTPPIIVDSPVIVEPSVVATPAVVVETPVVVDSPIGLEVPIVVESPVLVQRPVLAVSPVIALGPTLENASFDKRDKSVIVSVRDHQIKINSFAETMSMVMVYDLGGKLLYENGHINSNEFVIQELNSSSQFLIVITQLANENRIAKRIVL